MSDSAHNTVPASPPPRRSVRWWTLLLGTIAGVALIALGAMFASPIRGGVATLLHAGHDEQHEADEGWWTCGMHPWVVLPAPEGGCPICGMDLVPLDPSEFTGEVAIDPLIVQNIGVRVGEVTSGPLTQEIRTVGNVVVDETRVADVNTKFSGWIEELFVDETGERVAAGDPLFSVYSPELYAAADEFRLAQANAENAPEASVQQDVLQAARQRLELLGLSDKEIARLSDDGGRTVTLMSPVTGTVLEKKATGGMRIEPGMRMYRIADLSRVWIQAAVYEADLPLIEVGQPAIMTLPYLPGETFEGKVTFISPTLDPDTRQAQVRLEFDNEQGRLKPGMFAEVTLENVADDEAVLVDRSAVLNTGERQVAFVSLGEGRFEPREVALGLDADNGKVQVLSGLEPGEKVVTSGQFLLDSEARVRESLARMLDSGMAADQEATVEVAETDTVALPAEAAEPLNDVLRAYLEISDTLSHDSTEGIAALADELTEAAARLAPETPSLDAKALAAAAADLREAGDDLATARLAFAKVSHQIVPFTQQTGVPATFTGGEVQALECPMYPPNQTSPWLQLAGDPRNPYMGSAMLACFSERIQLPTTPVAEGGAQ